MTQCWHIKVQGDVQMVGYRCFVHYRAGLLGLTGWVCNHVDGSVEIMAQGAEAELTSLFEACQTGPSMAHVTSCAKQTVELQSFTHFDVVTASC